MPRSTAAALVSLALLALAACGGGSPDDDRTAGPAVVDVQLSIDTPTTLDSGSRVSADITVRANEPDGVRVRLQPYVEGLIRYPFTSRQTSDVLTGPVATGKAYFLTVVADDDVAFDGVLVRVLSASGEPLLDEIVDAPFTFRSLASTDATLVPRSGTLNQGQPVQIDVDFTLDEVRPVRVAVGPMAPPDYDEQISGDWFDVHETAFASFEGVAAGTLSGSFTILGDAVGDVRVQEVYVSILDETTGLEIYAGYLPVDLTFVEPGS